MNILTIDTLKEKGYNPLSYRFMCLQSHYRKPLIFSYEALDIAEVAYKKLKNKVLSLNKDAVVDNNKYQEFNDKFKSTLEDDMNTANSLSVIYDVLKDDINDATKYKLISDFDKVLSLDLFKEEIKEIDEEFIKEKINERNIAKQNKDFTRADAIRDELLQMGIILKDTREGTKFEVK